MHATKKFILSQFFIYRHLLHYENKLFDYMDIKAYYNKKHKKYDLISNEVIVQLAEHFAHNKIVVGSNPTNLRKNVYIHNKTGNKVYYGFVQYTTYPKQNEFCSVYYVSSLF